MTRVRFPLPDLGDGWPYVVGFGVAAAAVLTFDIARSSGNSSLVPLLIAASIAGYYYDGETSATRLGWWIGVIGIVPFLATAVEIFLSGYSPIESRLSALFGGLLLCLVLLLFVSFSVFFGALSAWIGDLIGNQIRSRVPRRAAGR